MGARVSVSGETRYSRVRVGVKVRRLRLHNTVLLRFIFQIGLVCRYYRVLNIGDDSGFILDFGWRDGLCAGGGQVEEFVVDADGRRPPTWQPEAERRANSLFQSTI
jgi:hypothetical protein